MNLIHISQSNMIYPGLRTQAGFLHKLPECTCVKEEHAGEMLKKISGVKCLMFTSRCKFLDRICPRFQETVKGYCN